MLLVGGDRHHPAFTVWAIDAASPDHWDLIPASGGDDQYSFSSAAVYDSLQDRVILAVRREYFQGPDQAFGLWALDLSGPPLWHLLAPGGPPVDWTLQYGATEIRLALNPDGRRLFMSGGNRPGDLWTLDLVTSSWSPVDTVASAQHVAIDGLGYDRARQRLLISRGGRVWNVAPGPPAIWNPISDAGSYFWARLIAPDFAHGRLVLCGEDLYVADMPADGGPFTDRSYPPASRRSSFTTTAIAFDPTRGVLWAHGGHTSSTYESHSDAFRMKVVPGSDTWAWDSILVTSGRTRLWHTLLIDDAARRAVVVGGSCRDETMPSVMFHGYDDRGAGAEIPVVTGPAPPQGFGQSAVIDPVERRVLFRRAYDTTLLALTLDPPHAWSVLTPAGSGPGPRRFASFVYEARRDRFLFFGGDDGSTYADGIWELVLRPAPTWRPLASNWDDLPAPPVDAFMDDDDGCIVLRFFENTFGRLQLGPDSVHFENIPSTHPASFLYRSLGYDPIRNAVLLADRDESGRLRPAAMWRVTIGAGADWEPLPSNTPRPYYRYLQGSVFSRTRDGLVMYGGWEDYDHDFDDWWILEMQEPVPTLVSLVRSDVSADAARIEWALGGDAVERVGVERRDADSDWRSIGAVVVSGDRRVVFEDRALRPATRYGYRLRSARATFGETWVETAPRSSLALLGVSRATDVRWEVRFSLARAGDAQLELFDVGGRCLARVRLDGRAAGLQRASLDATGSEASGVYFVRLLDDRDARVRRVVAIR